VNDLVGKIIYDIREIIIANSINLYKLFEKFDKDKVRNKQKKNNI
jgi:hypothetical protein